MRFDGEWKKRKLRCRIVPPGNRDWLKDETRSDSSTAQFPVIQTVLSIAVMHRFVLATLEAGNLGKDIYMRLPTGSESSRGEVWKLLKPAYGLFKSAVFSRRL